MKARREGPDYHNRTLIHGPPHDHKILVFSYEKKRFLRVFMGVLNDIFLPIFVCIRPFLTIDFEWRGQWHFSSQQNFFSPGGKIR